MEVIYRQKPPSKLTVKQRQDKLIKDAEYELAVKNLTTPFYQKKKTVGVTKKEEDDYRQAKSQLWTNYKSWAIVNGLYDEITPQQQLAEAIAELNNQVLEVNEMKAELGQKPVQIIEVI